MSQARFLLDDGGVGVGASGMRRGQVCKIQHTEHHTHACTHTYIHANKIIITRTHSHTYVRTMARTDIPFQTHTIAHKYKQSQSSVDLLSLARCEWCSHSLTCSVLPASHFTDSVIHSPLLSSHSSPSLPAPFLHSYPSFPLTHSSSHEITLLRTPCICK